MTRLRATSFFPLRVNDEMKSPDFSAHPRGPERSPAADEGAPESASAADSLRVLVSCVLAWAIPGLGHIASGRVGRGIVFALIVLSLFFGGILLHGKVYRPEPGEPLTYLAAVGAAGVGLPYVVAQKAGWNLGDIRSQSYEYGNTFTLVAGLLNLLIVLDAYDVASGRR